MRRSPTPMNGSPTHLTISEPRLEENPFRRNNCGVHLYLLDLEICDTSDIFEMWERRGKILSLHDCSAREQLWGAYTLKSRHRNPAISRFNYLSTAGQIVKPRKSRINRKKYTYELIPDTPKVATPKWIKSQKYTYELVPDTLKSGGKTHRHSRVEYVSHGWSSPKNVSSVTGGGT